MTRGKFVLAAMMLVGVSLVGTADAEPARCSAAESSGRWHHDCVGVDDYGCVGTWGASGTYEDIPGGGRIYRTDASYRDTVCPSMLTTPAVGGLCVVGTDMTAPEVSGTGCAQ